MRERHLINKLSNPDGVLWGCEGWVAPGVCANWNGYIWLPKVHPWIADEALLKALAPGEITYTAPDKNSLGVEGLVYGFDTSHIWDTPQTQNIEVVAAQVSVWLMNASQARTLPIPTQTKEATVQQTYANNNSLQTDALHNLNLCVGRWGKVLTAAALGIPLARLRKALKKDGIVYRLALAEKIELLGHEAERGLSPSRIKVAGLDYERV